MASWPSRPHRTLPGARTSTYPSSSARRAAGFLGPYQMQRLPSQLVRCLILDTPFQ